MSFSLNTTCVFVCLLVCFKETLMVNMKFPKLHSSAPQELAADVTAERPAAGKLPKTNRSSAQKKRIALKMKAKRLQGCVCVLEKHLSHTTRNEKRLFRISKGWHSQGEHDFANGGAPC